MTSLVREQADGDMAALRAVREGRTSLFREVYDRHQPAVRAYALTCTTSPGLASKLVSVAFTKLGERVTSPHPLDRGRHAGCVRLQLLESTRLAAVADALKHPHAFSAGFMAWIASGSVWPMHDDGQLQVAYEGLTPVEQCLLWHTLVEQDDLTAVADITGLMGRDLRARLTTADRGLRRSRMELYLERVDSEDCIKILGGSRGLPYSPPGPEVSEHLAACARCRALYDELVRFDARAARHLPLRLLGWWRAEDYRRNKEATAGRPPRGRPARGAPAARPAGTGRRRRRAAGPVRKARTWLLGTRRRATVLLAVSATVATALTCTLALRWMESSEPAGCGPDGHDPGVTEPPGPSPSLSARLRVNADEYTAQEGTEASDLGFRHARSLSDGDQLRYARVDFGREGDGRLVTRVSNGSEGGARLELRLDCPDSQPWATITVPADGEQEDVTAEVQAVQGGHMVYITAVCDTRRPCGDLHWFGTVAY
ncbi:carbohydrate-binding protein [Streptomyces sp. NA02950]|uniref:carbohydrate-binding protein n=1 Tax=Streptomyces sp. NA02950 TaxID=2742137 RepID=UPI001591DC1F|nr:carbohydrate-binding protein [Streptomyces sp. NA02950]QKV90881.1 carbohydrate-binding protein [Streptomyces sp. NA02950]